MTPRRGGVAPSLRRRHIADRIRAPASVRDWVDRICAANNVEPPGIEFYRARTPGWTYGRCEPHNSLIVIATTTTEAGEFNDSMWCVLLHELAHWMMPPEAGHSWAYWRRLWMLCYTWLDGELFEWSRITEAEYKPLSARVFKTMFTSKPRDAEEPAA